MTLKNKTNKELLNLIIKEGAGDIYNSSAIRELAVRVARPEAGAEIRLDRPSAIVDWLQLEIGGSGQEHFMALYLDKQNRLIDYKILFTGTLDRTLVHPRDIFREAVKTNASRIILAHNHPSGSTKPSQADIDTTRVLIEGSELLGIHILDHLIVASGGGFISLREREPSLFI